MPAAHTRLSDRIRVAYPLQCCRIKVPVQGPAKQGGTLQPVRTSPPIFCCTVSLQLFKAQAVPVCPPYQDLAVIGPKGLKSVCTRTACHVAPPRGPPRSSAQGHGCGRRGALKAPTDWATISVPPPLHPPSSACCRWGGCLCGLLAPPNGYCRTRRAQQGQPWELAGGESPQSCADTAGPWLGWLPRFDRTFYAIVQLDPPSWDCWTVGLQTVSQSGEVLFCHTPSQQEHSRRAMQIQIDR